MKEISQKQNITIFRPFINLLKKDIYDFAHKYNIPYFKDTTPNWSNRGKLRNQIFPLLNDVSNNKFLLNFDKIAKESKELKQIVLSCIIKPFIKNHVIVNYRTTENNLSPTNNKPIDNIIINISDYYDLPVTFWSYVIMNIFHNINIQMISNKSLNVLVYKINNKFIGKIPINRKIICILDSKNIKLNFE